MNARVDPMSLAIASIMPPRFTADNACSEISRLPLTVNNLKAVIGEVCQMASQCPGAWDVHTYLIDAFRACECIGANHD